MTTDETSTGFALIETLIAVAIMAAMAAMTFATIGSNAQAVRAVHDRRMAAMVAQSALDDMVGGDAVTERTGTGGGLVWRGSIAPYSAGAIGAPPLDRIVVTVARPGERAILLRLATLRLRI